jgi:hypothetical protein
MKPIISSAFAQLSISEIDLLRRGKKEISDYAQRALKDRVAAALRDET